MQQPAEFKPDLMITRRVLYRCVTTSALPHGKDPRRKLGRSLVAYLIYFKAKQAVVVVKWLSRLAHDREVSSSNPAAAKSNFRLLTDQILFSVSERT